jgi:glycogen(starch) synthase
MRFLFVSNLYPPHDIGGYEKHCQEVTDALRCRGHDVQVLTSRHGVSTPGQEGHVRRSLFLEGDLLHYNPVRFWTHRQQEERHNTSETSATITRAAPDAILFWGMWNLSRRVPALAESTGLPVAYWLSDLWPLDPDTHTRYWRSCAKGRLGRPFMSWVSRLALRRLAAEGYPPALQFRHVASSSQFIKRKLAATIPAFENATVVMGGIDLGMFAHYQAHEHMRDPTAPRIIYVGGLGPHKGVHTAVEAVSCLIRREPGLLPTLTIAGSGHPDYTARLQDLTRSTGTAVRVHFIGPVAKEAVPALLATYDIMVVPSVVEEAFARVVVEGMAAGLVVVGTATGGCAEILVDGANGLVFPVEDVEALAERLLRLARDPVLYARLAREGKSSSRRFDLKRMVDDMERFLVDVAASGRPGMAPDG